MVIQGKEIYLTATEAANHLGIARKTFYVRYKKDLTAYSIKNGKRPHYKQADIEALNTVEPIREQLPAGGKPEAKLTPGEEPVGAQSSVT
jgi:hypothetical protein